MPCEPAITVTGLGKRYKLYRKPLHRLLEWLTWGRTARHDVHWALCELDFTVPRGETFGIIGRNGAGKSTLLGILAGILEPTIGRYEVNGRVSAILNLGAGLDAELTGAENILQLTALAGIARNRADEQLVAIAAFADLGEFLHRPVKTYSAGMQLRLAFAVAVWERPDVLVVDEVLAVGDFFFRQKCHRKIQEMIAAGTTVILVSHDYSEVSQFCKRALLLDHGRVAFLGDARQAVTRYLMLERHGDAERGAEEPPVTAATAPQAAFFWPTRDEQLDTSRCTWVGAGDARCTALAICDGAGRQTRVFDQGARASFFVEVEAGVPLAVPVVSILIHDAKGQLVHGISTYQRLEEAPAPLAADRRLRVRFDIDLGLQYGEYGFDVGIGDIPVSVYNQRSSLGFETLGGHTRQIGRITDAAVFAVVPRHANRTVQLSHHGLADLPGTITIHQPQG